MLDNLKFRIEEKTIISKLLLHNDFVSISSNVNNISKFKQKKIGAKFHFEFCKEFERGQFNGYKYADVCISPHYHFNNNLHNGNNFTPENSIKTIIDILNYLGIEQREYNELKVVNIEFGLNIIPETDIKSLIDGLYFCKKTPFKTGAFPYFKKTDATSYKQIKAYAKGLQFLEFPQYGIHPNTFRFEVKSKQAKNIEKYGIWNANDLTKLDIYKTLTQILVDEWENVLLINQTPDFSNLKPDEVQFIRNGNKIDFWDDLKDDSNRNKFNRYKEKYYRFLKGKNNLHHLIKLQIIDKLNSYQSGANSTQENPINTRKEVLAHTPIQLINLEYAPPNENNRVCLVTNLDISMQRRGSKFLCFAGLKYYKEFESDIYKDLENRFLSEKMKVRDTDSQIYYIAHNIRNIKTNPNHNRKRFENRNYNRLQLQFNF